MRSHGAEAIAVRTPPADRRSPDARNPRRVLKACAARAFLAADDEEGASPGDPKVLVRLTVNWIESALLERSYLAVAA